MKYKRVGRRNYDYQVLVREYRGDTSLNVPIDIICRINEEGRVLYSVDNENHMTFLRTVAKPFQAILVIQNGVDDKFGLHPKKLSYLLLRNVEKTTT